METEQEPLSTRVANIGNPALREAMHYYIERQAMNNPKGWGIVRTVVRDAYSAGVVVCTVEQYIEAQSVLAILEATE